MSEAVVHGYPHGGMFLGRGVKTNNIVTRDGVVKEAVEAAALSAVEASAGALRAWQESSFG